MSHSLRHGSLPGIQAVKLPELFPDALIDSYLKRLAVERPVVPNLEALNTLLAAHVDKVAYENIDIKLEKQLPHLSARASAERIALHGRGGYCFLLVDAFSGLLCSLGFTVSLHPSACTHNPDPPAASALGNHVVALVHLDSGTYIADVGLGEGPRSAFLLEEHSWEEEGFSFKLEKRHDESVPYNWCFMNPANVTGICWGFWVDTTTSVAGLHEFQAFHEHLWLSGQTAYSTGPHFCHRKTTGRGVLSIFGCTLRRSHPEFGEKKYEVLETATSKDEWFMLVRNTFFMPLDDLSSEERDLLWAQVSDGHAAWLEKKGMTKRMQAPEDVSAEVSLVGA